MISFSAFDIIMYAVLRHGEMKVIEDEVNRLADGVEMGAAKLDAAGGQTTGTGIPQVAFTANGMSSGATGVQALLPITQGIVPTAVSDNSSGVISVPCAVYNSKYRSNLIALPSRFPSRRKPNGSKSKSLFHQERCPDRWSRLTSTGRSSRCRCHPEWGPVKYSWLRFRPQRLFNFI